MNVLPVDQPNDVARDYAISAASMFDAHLSGIVVAPEFPRWAMSEGVSARIVEEWSAERRAEAKKSAKLFDDRVRLRGLRADSRIVPDRLGESARLFSEIARNYDVSVVAQPEDEGDMRGGLLIEAALFNSGRPLLVVPFIQAKDIKLERVMVCWDGSQHAARAVGAAAPFLERARKVEVITVEDKERPDELRGIKIAEHLSRRRVDVELKPIVAPDSEAADVILNEVAEANIDLIIMGAYGHSRFREFVLGGVTRSMLKAMTAPVLMAH